LGRDRKSRRGQENSSENEVGSRSAGERAIEKICEGRGCNEHDRNICANIDIGGGNHDSSLNDGCNCNTRCNDDASPSHVGGADCVRTFDADVIARGFSNGIATPRTVACPERDATERTFTIHAFEFSGCERHDSFNENHSAARRITACPGRFASSRNEARKIQITGPTIPTAKN
jgi:hypothetical protein